MSAEVTELDTMTVTVRDRAAESPWGSGRCDPKTRTITISARCPRCCAPRGKPQGLNSIDDGAHYWVQTWKNPCGHIDLYEAVLAEADARSTLSRSANGPPG